MKHTVAAILLSLIASCSAHDSLRNRRHADIAHKRQAPAPPAGSVSQKSSLPSSASSAFSSPSLASTSSPLMPSNTAPPSPAYSVSGVSGAIPLSQITSGMPSAPTFAVSSTYAAGAAPTYFPGPALPAPFVYNAANWPPQDVVVDPTLPQVQVWMKELDGYDIPDIPPTSGSCAGSPNSTTYAQVNGWWTCGGYTRVTDIVACPDKMTWGLSFDDGPSPYTQTLLNYLNQQSLLATFFVVGSRVIERPAVLVEEYMAGHQISVHTWSHRPLTSLTNEQIVGELGYTREVIKAVLGTTPTTMRPPFGDIDDRVRAISLAMGLVPIIWTSAPQSGPFDTNDWKVAGGLVTGAQSLATFEAILGNATVIPTGFIVLEHDLFQVTVDLATQYTLNSALHHTPPFNLMPIGQCSKTPITDWYRETTTNKTFPYPVQAAGIPNSGGQSASTTSGSVASHNIPFGWLVLVGMISSLLVGSTSIFGLSIDV